MKTRHNVGFQTVDTLAEKIGVKLKKLVFKSYIRAKGVYHGREIVLVKPLTFMNRSGIILGDVLRYARASIDDIVVVCDNLDLEPGICRFRLKGSSAGNKGLASLIDHAGTRDFKRLYIGIGRPPFRGDVIRYVLGVPGKEDRTRIAASIRCASEGILMLLEKSPEEVMNSVNGGER
ncbi:MAG: aminoacyl-tRNA hydrolase [Spirochaetales bacterium]|nr:aminoacyl-tRNA hydrolase [Spirochaetales bacterium]